MLLETEGWKQKRNQAKHHLKLAKVKNSIESCKVAAWEIEFWGRVSILESWMTQSGYSQGWLLSQVKNALLADERYFIDLASREPEYSMIPQKIREILDDEC